MLKILFDHQAFSLQRYGGISRYFANLYHASQNQTECLSAISVLYSKNYYIKDYPGALGSTLGSILLNKERKIYKWNAKYSKYIIDKNDFDVFHPTYYDPYFIDHIKKPVVITIHDMIHEKFPDYFDTGDSSAYNKRLCIEKADHIIAISDATKKDIQHFYNIPDEKITVIHHGFQPFEVKEKQKSLSQQNYLLYVGDRRAYKNFSLFITAITPLLKKDSSLKIMCIGGGNFKQAELEIIMRLKIQNQIFQLTASDDDLIKLYENAIAFIYPSLCEGFGLPLLEAFQHDCPIVASDIDCFREIGGNAVQYFDPYIEQDILYNIEQIIDNESLRKTLIENGRRQLLKFPISLCTEKTINVYKTLAQNN